MVKPYRFLLILASMIIPSLLIVSSLSAQSEAWSTSAVTFEPPVVDYRQTSEVTVTVGLTNTGEAAHNVLTVCSVQSGEVITTGPGVYALSANSVAWVGDVTDTQCFSLTAHATTLDHVAVPCAIVYNGVLQHTITGTADVIPYAFYLPLSLHTYAAPMETYTVELEPAGGYLSSTSFASYAEALAGHSLQFVDDRWQGGLFRIVREALPGSPAFPPTYSILRAVLEFDTPSLPAGAVIERMELVTRVTGYDNPLFLQTDFSVQRGTWLSLTGDLAATWSDWMHEPLAYQTAVVSGTLVTLNLPVTAVTPGEPLRLLVRSMPEDVEPTLPSSVVGLYWQRAETKLRVTYHLVSTP
jgi:hypothetical protein